jgi:hypothetical protein
VFYFAWVWLFVMVWARTLGIATLGDVLVALRQRKSLAVELVIVAAGAGLLPYLSVNFNSPSWKFFTEFQAVLAGVFVAAYLENIRPSQLWNKVRNGALSIGALLGMGLAFAVAGHLFMTTGGSVYRTLKRSGEVRSLLAGGPASAWKPALRHIRDRKALTVEAFAKRIELVKCLNDFGARSPSERRAIALYIPKTNRTYWDMRQVGPGATPFIAPALSGMAMVDGLPEYEDIGWAAIGWGYPQYSLPAAPQVPREMLEEALQKARSHGFRTLLVFRDSEVSSCQLQSVPLN